MGETVAVAGTRVLVDVGSGAVGVGGWIVGVVVAGWLVKVAASGWLEGISDDWFSAQAASIKFIIFTWSLE